MKTITILTLLIALTLFTAGCMENKSATTPKASGTKTTQAVQTPAKDTGQPSVDSGVQDPAEELNKTFISEEDTVEIGDMI